ncbi:hypothetical protein BpHYR1_042001 [Brachionus plicatilis]|uniref:Chromo domain-containing protein n=1 Tax=Brachionus plicatilis TaxID=10195 RepID=A0A3M7S496_BRAPC|nr:hypothetical protein BpHYR1_042001 [Brachionus plicatilis]
MIWKLNDQRELHLTPELKHLHFPRVQVPLHWQEISISFKSLSRLLKIFCPHNSQIGSFDNLEQRCSDMIRSKNSNVHQVQQIVEQSCAKRKQLSDLCANRRKQLDGSLILQTEEKSSSSNKNQLEQKIPTKSPIVNMGCQIPSTLEKPLKSRLGEDTQSGETSESESEMVEGKTISTLTTITDETVTAPDATTSSEATARLINVPGCSNQNDMVDEEPEEEEEDFIPPEEILKQQLMSEFKRNSKFDLRDVEYFINGIIGHKFEDGKLKLLLKWDKVGKKEYQDSWEAFSDVYAPTLYKNYS